MNTTPQHDPWLGEMLRTWAIAGAAKFVDFDRTLHALLTLAAVVSAVVGLWRFVWERNDRRARRLEREVPKP